MARASLQWSSGLLPPGGRAEKIREGGREFEDVGVMKNFIHTK